MTTLYDFPSSNLDPNLQADLRATPININSNIPLKKYNLSDLRKDPEFNKVTERFLTSIGEGDSVGDLFGYFRGADYNLTDGIMAYKDSKKFTDQQKQDYQYLRSKFDNSSIGGFREWVKAGANVTKELFTDPTMIASMFFIPWTGGASAATRIAAGKAVQAGLKKLASKEVAKGVAKGVSKIPFQKIKKTGLGRKVDPDTGKIILTKSGQTALTAVEGFVYGSSNNFVKQNIDINTDRREAEDLNLKETALVGTAAAAIPVGLRGIGMGISKFQTSVANRRLARIDGGEEYKSGTLDKGIKLTDEILDVVTPNIIKLGAFVQKPTSKFIRKMKLDKELDKLIKLFRYDADKSMFIDPSKIVKRTGYSFYENVFFLLGPRRNELKDILDSLKKKGTVTKPKIGSRDAFFKLPDSRFYKAPAATKQSRFQYQRISDSVNDALAYYLRTGRKTVTVDGKRVSFEKAFNMTERTTGDILEAGTKIKILLREIRNDAKAKGLEVGRIRNYLPRSFLFSKVKEEIENLHKGIEGALSKEIRRAEGVTTKGEVIEILESIMNPTTAIGKSYSHLMKQGHGGKRGTRGVGYFGIHSKKIPTFTKKRQLRNIKEENISDYLDNSVESLLYDYVHQSSSYIQRKVDFGEDIIEFRKLWLDPIQKRLKAKGKKFELSDKEYRQLEDLYMVTTGQVSQVDNAFMRTMADLFVVGNQLALLPLATITSLSEIAVPLVRGAGKTLTQKGKAGTKGEIGEGGIRTIWKTAGDYRKMWWNDIFKKDIADGRPASLKELNRFGRAWDRASDDRSLAMFGQGYGRRGTEAQNKFFKLNLLHDWTRFVQLVSYNVGKSKIYENLYELVTVKNMSKARKLRLSNQLRELNIDVAAGKKWVKAGGKPSGKFYNENFLRGASRYVDEVIMNPTAAANQKPIWHSMHSTRWAFGLMGFPTAFSNTVLKNAIREINLDIRSQGLKFYNYEAIPSMTAGATTMLAIGMFGNTIRTGGRNLEEIEKGEETIGGEVLDAAIRAGLLGPTEQAYRTYRARAYDNFARRLAMRFTGPAVDDIFRFFEDWVGPISFVIDEIPGIAALRTMDPEGYKAVMTEARKLDKSMGWAAQGKEKKEKEKKGPRPLFYEGGQIFIKNPRYKKFKGGAVSEDYPVPNVIKDPSERINPYTGQPYDAEMERLGLAEGSEVKAEPLLQRILQNIVRASPEEERELSETKGYENTPKNKRYGEVKGNKVYIFEDRLREDGSTGNFVEDMFFGEALHRLKDTAPEWYDRLYSAANEDPEVMKWKEDAYQREVADGYKGTREQHWNESRFDQVVGGFLLGRPDANVHTMRGWDRNTLPYGTHLRKELEAFEKELGRTKKKDGGLMVSIGVAPVSEKQIDKLKKALEKRKAKRDGGSADIEEIVVKALKRIPQKGKEAYEYAIDKMGENNLDKQFLKEIAYVESKYAEDEGSFRKDNRSAYQITPLAFQEFKETINPNSSRGRGLRAYANKIKDRYDVDISKVTYDELNDPLIGTAVTRALWKLDPEPIGNTVKERANQWKRYWNTEEGKGTVDRYLDDVTFMNK